MTDFYFYEREVPSMSKAESLKNGKNDVYIFQCLPVPFRFRRER